MQQPTSPQNDANQCDPLYDNDLSELTKNEVLYWSRKLQLTPSELFTLSEEELERYLAAAHQLDRQRDEELCRMHQRQWHRLNQMKHELMVQQKRLRLTGGDNSRTVWEILAEAACEIENSMSDMPQRIVSGCECEGGRIMGGACGMGAGGSCGMGGGRGCPPRAFSPAPRSCLPPPPPPDPCEESCGPPPPKPYFRNYTDYSMQYDRDTINECTQSITVHECDSCTGKVNAISRTFRVPRKNQPPQEPPCPPPCPTSCPMPPRQTFSCQPPCPPPPCPPPPCPPPPCPPPCPPSQSRPQQPCPLAKSCPCSSCQMPPKKACPMPSRGSCPMPRGGSCPMPSGGSCPMPNQGSCQLSNQDSCPMSNQNSAQMARPSSCPIPSRTPTRTPCTTPCPKMPRPPSRVDICCSSRMAKCPNLPKPTKFESDCG